MLSGSRLPLKINQELSSAHMEDEDYMTGDT